MNGRAYYNVISSLFAVGFQMGISIFLFFVCVVIDFIKYAFFRKAASKTHSTWLIHASLAARQGFEPRQKEPESFVLPLHHRAKYSVNLAKNQTNVKSGEHAEVPFPNSIRIRRTTIPTRSIIRKRCTYKTRPHATAKRHVHRKASRILLVLQFFVSA